ncbi:MAG: hypothetical protein D6736_19140 [Nitrospinota bacterium]|nr:MAG: hypothetical protein D6736_19140 [Nitrospinota bacterium]
MAGRMLWVLLGIMLAMPGFFPEPCPAWADGGHGLRVGQVNTAGHLRRLVAFRPGIEEGEQKRVIRESGSLLLKAFPLLNGALIQLPPDQAETALDFLYRHPAVERIEEDVSLGAESQRYPSPTATPGGEGGVQGSLIIPADPEMLEESEEDYPWNLWQIYLDQADPRRQGDKVDIAVLDTGIDPTHPDLHKIVARGYNARIGEEERDTLDRNGHGTHIAGIIAAKLRKRSHLRGIAPRAKLYPVKVLGDDGSGYLSDLINGLNWVYKNRKIRIVNMSLGFSTGSELLHRMVRLLHEAGVIMVASAGNYDTTGASGEGAAGEGAAGEGAAGTGCASGEGAAGEGAAGEGAASGGGCLSQEQVKYPARYPETIAVGATDIEAEVTDYSIRGPEVDLVAPGGDRQDPVLSINLNKGYGLGSGTSQAAAHVTGLVALLLSVDRTLTPEEIRQILQDTALDLGLDWEAQGAGLIDAALAIDQVQSK